MDGVLIHLSDSNLFNLFTKKIRSYTCVTSLLHVGGNKSFYNLCYFLGCINLKVNSGYLWNFIKTRHFSHRCQQKLYNNPFFSSSCNVSSCSYVSRLQRASCLSCNFVFVCVHIDYLFIILQMYLFMYLYLFIGLECTFKLIKSFSWFTGCADFFGAG